MDVIGVGERHNIEFLPTIEVTRVVGAQLGQLDRVMKAWVEDVNKAYLSYFLASEAMKMQVGSVEAAFIMNTPANGVFIVSQAALNGAMMEVPTGDIASASLTSFGNLRRELSRAMSEHTDPLHQLDQALARC